MIQGVLWMIEQYLKYKEIRKAARKIQKKERKDAKKKMKKKEVKEEGIGGKENQKDG